MRLPVLSEATLPFAFLFAALLSLLGLSRKLELIVARASGVSVWGVLRAPALIALALGFPLRLFSIRSRSNFRNERKA
jgi:lipopolysaccharide export system permease protein